MYCDSSSCGFITFLKSNIQVKMSIQNENNDDLTTDACPSPPRDNKSCKSSGDESDNKETQYGEEIPTNRKTSYCRNSKSRGFTKIKRSNPAATAYASIININNSTDVHVGAKITYNFESKSGVKGNKANIEETPAITSLLISSNPVTKNDLLFVSTHMNESWRDVARALNYSDGQIQQFVIDHTHYGIKEVIYQCLLDWTQNEPTEATVGNLAKVMWENNQKDVVKRWSEKK